jgi:hypothetical protein
VVRAVVSYLFEDARVLLDESQGLRAFRERKHFVRMVELGSAEGEIGREWESGAAPVVV